MSGTKWLLGNSSYINRKSWDEYSSKSWNEVSSITWDEMGGFEEGQKLYTIIDGELIPLSESTLTSELFIEHGFDFIPTYEYISQIENPIVLYWNDEASQFQNYNANVTATPFAQEIISERVDLTETFIIGIKSVSVTCTGDFEAFVSFDELKTWKIWNGSDWVTSETGMNKQTIESISVNQWDLIFKDSESFYLKVKLSDTNQKVKRVHIEFKNP